MPRRRRQNLPPLKKTQGKHETILRLKTLRIEKDPIHPVCFVVLDCPSKRNALSRLALRELESAFLFLGRRYDIRVAVLKGEGKSFCGGMDLSEPRVSPLPPTIRERREVFLQGQRTIRAIDDADFATVACVHGHAVGGGFGLVLACDLRVVEKNTLLCFPEIDIGVPVPWGLAPLLIRDAGLPVAKELMWMGSDITARRAMRLGLVNRVCEGYEATSEEAENLAYGLASKRENALTLAVTQFRGIASSGHKQGSVRHEPDWMQLAPRSRM
eukprot:g625.t1